MTDTRTPPKEPGAALLSAARFFRPGTPAPDLHSAALTGGREADAFHRDRRSHDRVVRSTHGVNRTGSCRWKGYVKDGISRAGVGRPAGRGPCDDAGLERPDGSPGMGGDGRFGRDSGRKLLPVVSVRNLHGLRRRQTAGTPDEAKED